MKLFKSADLAVNHGIKAAIDAFDVEDRFAPFTPERAQYDSEYRIALEAMEPEDFAQTMRDTIYALFDGSYVSLGMTKEMLTGIQCPTMIMPGNNDVHPRGVAERLHRLIPNAKWGEVAPHTEDPKTYIRRVVEFLAEVEAD